jgi:hypothetical protein
MQTTAFCLFVSTALATVLGFGAIRLAGSAGPPVLSFDEEIERHAEQLLRDGKQIFRFDTFGDEAFWSDKLLLH